MTGEPRLTRRGALALAGATAAAGCLDLFGGEPTLDAAAVAEAGSGPTPPVTAPLPVDVADDHVAAARERAEAALSGVPLPLSAEEIPNGAVRARLNEAADRARSRLDGGRVMGVRARLETLRNARRHARYVAAAWAFTRGDLAPADVRERARTVRVDAGGFRDDRAYVGTDPVRALLVHGVADAWAGTARRYATLDGTFDGQGADTALGIGDRAGDVEYGRALLDDATHVLDRHELSLSDPEPMGERLADARADLTDRVEARLAGFPDRDAAPPQLADADRDLEGTVALTALEDLHFRLPWRLEPGDGLAHTVLERFEGLVYADAFGRLRDRVEAGAEFGVETADQLGERRDAAVSAVEAALEESPDRRLARHVVDDVVWRLSRADAELQTYEGTVPASTLRWEVAEYVTATMVARSVPLACRATRDALGLDREE